ncbi:MAG: TRAP transporter permease [Deltaproteobacteria bacterium]|nr:TRAP transporter permease [Deltaproteobacteria bacterium]
MVEQQKSESLAKRELVGLWGYMLIIAGVGMSFFQIYTAGFGTYPAMIQRSIHLAFGFFLAFTLYPMIKKQSKSDVLKIVDIFIGIIAVFSCLHIIITYDTLLTRMGRPSQMDIIWGGILIILLIDMGRRSLGWPLPLISIAAMLYSYLGPYMPDILSHRGVSIPRIIAYMYTTTEGLFGIPMAVSATVVYAFILFGTFLIQSGTGDFIIDASYAIAGTSRGGPAKIAVVSSGFFGMISGSTVANVVSTGSFTIPLMKKIGFPAYFAGAVEAASSTGGQIMPPVMGAAIFIMAEIIGIPYIQICLAALIPACLYFLSIFFTIHFRAIKMNISGNTKEELPNLKDLIKKRGHLIIPPIFLVFFLIVMRYSPMKTAFWSIPIVIVVSMLRKSTRMSFAKILHAMKDAAFISVQIIAACGLAGIVMAVITQTGLGLKFSNLLITIAQQELFTTLFMVMFVSIVLGTGVTTSAAYIITSLLGASALENLGVQEIAAHLFILYFAVISFITPPVAIAAYAAAGIANANPFKTGFMATRIGFAGFIIPFMFVYQPSLLMTGSVFQIIGGILTAVTGIFALTASLEGYIVKKCQLWERCVLFATALLLIKPGNYSDLFGFLLLTMIFFRQIASLKSVYNYIKNGITGGNNDKRYQN